VAIDSHVNVLDAILADAEKRAMLAFVRERLTPADAESKSGKVWPHRSRYGHTLRVLAWALRVWDAEARAAGEQPRGSRERLAVAAIFHDSGYALGKEDHAAHSARVFAEYARAHGLERVYGADGVAQIEALVRTHSQKGRAVAETTFGDRCLMDADVLDEAGAMSFVWDCFALARGEAPYDYASALRRCQKRLEDLENMRPRLFTAAAQRFVDEMRAYLLPFLRGLAWELNI